MAKSSGKYGSKMSRKRDTHKVLFSDCQDNLFGRGNYSSKKEDPIWGNQEKAEKASIQKAARARNMVNEETKGRPYNPIVQTAVHYAV